MCYSAKSKPTYVRVISVVLLIFLLVILATRAEERTIPKKLSTPQGVRLLQNKSFDDSDQTRQRILELYRDLRLTDVLDAMDLIGLQDIGLMDKNIRPLWRDVEKFSHRIVGFAVTVRHVPTDIRVGQNSFEDLAGFKRFKSQQYKRAPDAWLEAAKPHDVAVLMPVESPNVVSSDPTIALVGPRKVS